MNIRLFNEGDVKEEVVDFIFEHAFVKESSYFKRGKKSHDWYNSDEPDIAELECYFELPLSLLEKTFGKISEEELNDLDHFLSESEKAKEMAREILNEIKPQEIESFYLNFLVKVDCKAIILEAKAEEMDINNLY